MLFLIGSASPSSMCWVCCRSLYRLSNKTPTYKDKCNRACHCCYLLQRPISWSQRSLCFVLQGEHHGMEISVPEGGKGHYQYPTNVSKGAKETKKLPDRGRGASTRVPMLCPFRPRCWLNSIVKVSHGRHREVNKLMEDTTPSRHGGKTSLSGITSALRACRSAAAARLNSLCWL